MTGCRKKLARPGGAVVLLADVIPMAAKARPWIDII
jgi:hypothetical protein